MTDEEHYCYEGEESHEATVEKAPSLIAVCKCLTSLPSSQKTPIPERKQRILSTTERTEEYLKERRVPELIRFFCSKLLADEPSFPVTYMDQLLDKCMLFRMGLGQAPVLFERRHLQAIIKSFDPLNRGWLTPGQVRRIFATIGLPPQVCTEDRCPTSEVISVLEIVQEKELLRLLSAGTDIMIDSKKPSETTSEQVISDGFSMISMI